MTTPTPRAYADLVYATTPQRQLRLDLLVPDAPTPPPLVLYIPMGGMRGCSKSTIPAWLTAYGLAVASIEARVSSEAIAPAPVHDCKSAVRFLRAHGAQYGFDPARIGAWGSSAGGLLASLLATSGDRPELEGDGPHQGVSSNIQAACDFCGAPHDFTWFARPDIIARHAGVVENLRLYLGGHVAEKPELAKLVSPSTYISPRCPPLLLVHGSADRVVPPEETVSYYEALKKAGVDVSLLMLPGIGHGWEPGLTRPAVVSFFRRALAAGRR